MNLLETINKVLSATKSFSVADWNDTAESRVVADIIYRQVKLLTNDRDIKELKKIKTLTALSDLDKPTSFMYPSSVDEVYWIKYKDTDSRYKLVHYLDPIEFINKTDINDPTATESQLVDMNGVKITVTNNRGPKYWTSFDDQTIIMDSFDSTVDNTLQESKVQAYVREYIEFEYSNTYELPIDPDLESVLLEQSISSAYLEIKGAGNPKAEAQARRSMILNRGNNRKDPQKPSWTAYAR